MTHQQRNLNNNLNLNIKRNDCPRWWATLKDQDKEKRFLQTFLFNFDVSIQQFVISLETWNLEKLSGTIKIAEILNASILHQKTIKVSKVTDSQLSSEQTLKYFNKDETFVVLSL